MIRLDKLNWKYKALIVLFVIVPLFLYMFYDMYSNIGVGSKPGKMICNGKVILIDWEKDNNCGYKVLYVNNETTFIVYNEWLVYQAMLQFNND